MHLPRICCCTSEKVNVIFLPACGICLSSLNHADKITIKREGGRERERERERETGKQIGVSREKLVTLLNE